MIIISFLYHKCQYGTCHGLVTNIKTIYGHLDSTEKLLTKFTSDELKEVEEKLMLFLGYKDR